MTDTRAGIVVKCQKGHRRFVLAGQIGPGSFPMCSEDRCYGPMFPQEARTRRPSDVLYNDGRPS